MGCEPENRVLFFIDVVVGVLLHRMGMTGEPMAAADRPDKLPARR
ncbi:hypothetical protein [Streptomyces sp. NPDC046925]